MVSELIEKDGDNTLHFVIETKANTSADALRPTELQKIECGYKHFEALGNNALFMAEDNFDNFIENV